MSYLIGILFALFILANMGAPAPVTTPPAATTTTLAPNTGGGHCGFGPNDSDVRGVVKVATPSTIPHC